jgi:hypothetical protein
VISLYAAGFSGFDVARILKKHPTGIYAILRRYAPEIVRPRSMEGYQKLSNSDFDKTRTLYEAGLTLKEVGEILGITHGAVRYRLLRGGVTLRPKAESIRRGWALRLGKLQKSELTQGENN